MVASVVLFATATALALAAVAAVEALLAGLGCAVEDIRAKSSRKARRDRHQRESHRPRPSSRRHLGSAARRWR